MDKPEAFPIKDSAIAEELQRVPAIAEELQRVPAIAEELQRVPAIASKNSNAKASMFCWTFDLAVANLDQKNKDFLTRIASTAEERGKRLFAIFNDYSTDSVYSYPSIEKFQSILETLIMGVENCPTDPVKSIIEDVENKWKLQFGCASWSEQLKKPHDETFYHLYIVAFIQTTRVCYCVKLGHKSDTLGKVD